MTKKDSPMTKKDMIRKWVYSLSGSKIIDYIQGDKLPAGWYASPAEIPKEKPSAPKPRKKKAKAK